MSLESSFITKDFEALHIDEDHTPPVTPQTALTSSIKRCSFDFIFTQVPGKSGLGDELMKVSNIIELSPIEQGGNGVPDLFQVRRNSNIHLASDQIISNTPCLNNIQEKKNDGPDSRVFLVRNLRRNLRIRTNEIDFGHKIKRLIVRASPNFFFSGITTTMPIKRQHLETIFEEPVKQNGQLVPLHSSKVPKALAAQRVYKITKSTDNSRINKFKNRSRNDRLLTEERMKDMSKQFRKMGI